jgi:hypothetical protein
VDRCLHRYIDAITAVRRSEDGRSVLGMLVRIVNHAVTGCAPGNLQTMLTMRLLIRADLKLAVWGASSIAPLGYYCFSISFIDPVKSFTKNGHL